MKKAFLFWMIIFATIFFGKAQTLYFFMRFEGDTLLKTNFDTSENFLKLKHINFGFGVEGDLYFQKDFLDVYNLILDFYYKNDTNNSQKLEYFVEEGYVPNAEIKIFPNTGLVFAYQKNYVHGIPFLEFYDDTVYSMTGFGEENIRESNCVFSFFPETEQVTPMATVFTFLKSLNNHELKKAYAVQKVAAWGDYKHFSSTGGFGGITKVLTDTAYLIVATHDSAQVFVSATYYDTANYNLKIKEIFHLSQKNGKWFITKLTVKKIFGFASYAGKGELYTDSLTSKSFSFELYFTEGDYYQKPCPGGYAKGKAIKYAKNKYVFTKGDCKIYFTFTDKKHKVIISENGKCGKLRHKKLRFNDTFVISQ